MQFLIQIFIIRTFVCVTKTSDIRIFVRVNFLIQIFIIRTFVCVTKTLDIRSCKFFDTNIFGYLILSTCSRMSHFGPKQALF